MCIPPVPWQDCAMLKNTSNGSIESLQNEAGFTYTHHVQGGGKAPPIAPNMCQNQIFLCPYMQGTNRLSWISLFMACLLSSTWSLYAEGLNFLAEALPSALTPDTLRPSLADSSSDRSCETMSCVSSETVNGLVSRFAHDRDRSGLARQTYLVLHFHTNRLNLQSESNVGI
jgi:hypothetical protein